MNPINRTYNHLKTYRTYVGGSKEEELKIFKRTCAVKENINDVEIDWFEFRRLLIVRFEDSLWVVFSRKIVIKNSFYLFLGISLCLALLKFSMIFFIFFGISVMLYFIFEYLKYQKNKEINDYNLVVSLTNSAINTEFGLILPNVE